jgi:predicted metal-binding membrane protein
MTTIRHRAVFTPVLAGLAVLAWIALWAWSTGPYQRYLAHGDWFALGPAAFLCSVVPGATSRCRR